MVEFSWKEGGTQVWNLFVFKEKLKCLKVRLKAWNHDCFGLNDVVHKHMHEMHYKNEL